MKIKDWLYSWLSEEVKPTAKARTLTRYSEIVSNHLIPYLGELELSEITPAILQKMIAYLCCQGNLRTGGGLSANTVNAIITVIQSALKAAWRLGWISSYTANKIKRPRNAERRISCFNEKEQRTIEHAVLIDRRPKMFGIILALYTGLRIGELLALKWEDIDFIKSELLISKSCYDGQKDGRICYMIDTPKTPSSCRVIPIPKQVLALLSEQKKKIKSSWVICEKKKSTEVSPISVRSYQYSFTLLLKHLGIPHRGFHALRHTFATRALECGIDVKALSEILGHKNPSVTLSCYVHSLMSHKHDMMNRLGQLL